MNLRLVLTVLVSSAAVAFAAEEGFRPLFNGKDLSGWDGNPELWSVENGAITGKTTGPAQLGYNQFLIWRGGAVTNFELRAKVKSAGNNSGIQYRSRELAEVGKWSIAGYQCDIHPNTPYIAMTYEERGRGIVAQNGQRVLADPAGAKWLVAEHPPVQANVAEWCDYTIIARGNKTTHLVNGQVTMEFEDHDEQVRALSGLIAFQVHKGPAMSVQIKDVLLKDLPAGELIPFTPDRLPADAKQLGKPAPAKAKPADKAK